MEKNNKKKIIIAVALIVIWLAVIWVMSSMTGEGSGSLSKMILKMFPSLTESEIAHIVIRKLAHMTEYGILCGLIINLEYQLGYKIDLKQVGIAVVCSCIYAMTDEYHQTFVNERSGNIIDVLIDTCGAIIMGLIVLIINKCKTKKSS